MAATSPGFFARFDFATLIMSFITNACEGYTPWFCSAAVES